MYADLLVATVVRPNWWSASCKSGISTMGGIRTLALNAAFKYARNFWHAAFAPPAAFTHTVQGLGVGFRLKVLVVLQHLHTHLQGLNGRYSSLCSFTDPVTYISARGIYFRGVTDHDCNTNVQCSPWRRGHLRATRL